MISKYGKFVTLIEVKRATFNGLDSLQFSNVDCNNLCYFSTFCVRKVDKKYCNMLK